MRTAFIKTIEKLAEKNKNITLLTGDLGFTVFENFQKKFPNRFFNLGVAESNMMAMAAGMALCDQIPIVYSIATFASLRPYEFIRNDICYQNANVKIIGVGGGFGYGLAGISHSNIEDLAIMRLLPNLVILCPADPIEVEILTKQAIKHKGPVYLRLGKTNEPKLHTSKPNLKISKSFIIQPGKKVAIFTTGGILDNVLQASRILKTKNIIPTIVNFHTIKPLDINLIKKLSKQHKYIFTVEEHSVTGGLGSAIAEVLSESDIKVKFKRLGVNRNNLKTVGDQNFLRNRYGLSPQKIAHTIKKIILK